ncbi:MAG: Flp pilus assembly complex ATPase component TadA [Actinomycetota bacterium]|nr:Flp pilus assembly complex ATPase component TadA [Actinomycetota bacterium]
MFGWNTSTRIKKSMEDATSTEVRAPAVEDAPVAGGALPAGDRIEDILLSEGRVTREQLDLALTMQRNDPRRIGDILLSLGYVTAEDLGQALARRMRLDFVAIRELPPGEVDEEALGLLEEATLLKHRALPLRFEGERLVVAMSDPTDLYALDDLRMLANRTIRPVVVTEEDLNGAFVYLFGPAEPTVEPDQEVPAAQEGPAETNGSAVANAPEDEVGPGAVEEAVPGGVVPEEVVPEEVAFEEPEVAEAGAGQRGNAGTVGGRIGDILVAGGKITPRQLDETLALQREDRREIGRILLALGYIGKADLARALAERLRLEYVEITERDVDRAAASLVDPRVLRKYGAMPLRLDGGRLVVAMSEPNNFYALEDIRMISGYPVTPVVGVRDEIQKVQNKVYAVSAEVSELLEGSADGFDVEDIGELELGNETADNAPIVRLVSSILQQAVGEEASDIHIEPRARELAVRMRVDGVLREVMSVPSRLQNGVVARLKILANLNIAERRVPQDGRFSVRLGEQKVDLRAASLPTVFGEKVVLRLLNTSTIEVDLKGLGFAPEALEQYREVFQKPYGTILVTGPTGSGKSTTLYATLGELNSPEKNIITVEDPVEYRMPGVNQIQVNPGVGLTFASGLRSILRSDPDVLMIGEIRDRETAKISVEAALTGHLVLATLHTNNAPAAVTRLTDMGVEPFLTASAVDCVIAQRLARRLCERCKRPVEVDREKLATVQFPFHHAPEDGLNFHEAVGCDRCGGTGYKGRMGIYEMMIVTDEIKELVLRRVSTGDLSRAAEERGMVRLREDGLIKASRGETTIEEVLRTVV